jgi:hypothetical protein
MLSRARRDTEGLITGRHEDLKRLGQYEMRFGGLGLVKPDLNAIRDLPILHLHKRLMTIGRFCYSNICVL